MWRLHTPMSPRRLVVLHPPQQKSTFLVPKDVARSLLMVEGRQAGRCGGWVGVPAAMQLGASAACMCARCVYGPGPWAPATPVVECGCDATGDVTSVGRGVCMQGDVQRGRACCLLANCQQRTLLNIWRSPQALHTKTAVVRSSIRLRGVPARSRQQVEAIEGV
jgi:hypothetical protein